MIVIKEINPQQDFQVPFITREDIIGNIGNAKKGDIIIEKRRRDAAIPYLSIFVEANSSDEDAPTLSMEGFYEFLSQYGPALYDYICPADSSKPLSSEAKKIRNHLMLCFQRKQKVFKYLQDEHILDKDGRFNNKNTDFKKNVPKGLLIKAISVCVLNKEKVPKELCEALFIEGKYEAMRVSASRVMSQENSEQRYFKAFKVCKEIYQMCGKDFYEMS